MNAHPGTELHAVLAAALSTPPGPERTAALTALDRAVHGPGGFVRALREARTDDLAERLRTGATRATLAGELGVTPTRIDQLTDGNTRNRTAGRARARARGQSVRDQVNAARADLHARVLAERAAERARLGWPYLERLEAGENVRTMAKADGHSWQLVAAWIAAARAARDAEQPLT